MGNLRPWWNNASIEKFEVRTKCMVDQYSQYELNGNNVSTKELHYNASHDIAILDIMSSCLDCH